MILTPINYYLCLPRTFLKRIYGVWVVAVLLLSAILSTISDTCSKMKTLVFGWWKSMKYDHFRRVAVLKLIFIYDAMLNNLQKIAGLLVLYSFTSIVTKMSDKIKNWRRGWWLLQKRTMELRGNFCMREILSHFQYLSPPQLWECRGTPHALHERWGVLAV